MSVGSFDPKAINADLDLQLVRELLTRFDGETLDLDPDDQSRFAGLVTHLKWPMHVADFSVAEKVRLIRIFTLGEGRYAAWAAEEKSAVITLVKGLKAQGAYDKSLTRWIKDHSDNKFLPHGSLVDRL